MLWENFRQTAISSSKVLLVPYYKHHVPRYHEWMKSPEIQEATASEPLSEEEEYQMQASWRHDADKLTFIICQPLQKTIGSGENIAKDACSNVNCDADAAMLGDVNMFLTFNEDDQDDEDAESQSTPTDGTHHPPEVVGELELMIAERKNQKHGYGRAALLSFLLYVLRNEDTIVRGFLESKGYAPSREMSQRLDFFCVKIGADNVGSIRLFESLGFKKLKEEPNVFGELELRRMFDGNAHGIEETMELMRKYDVGQSVEMPYQR